MKVERLTTNGLFGEKAALVEILN